METLFQYAYTSCIRPEVSLTRVYEIVLASRRNNHLAGVTGILVFDGWRFFQYLEGADHSVCEIVEKIRLDQRHHNYVELLSRTFAGPRQFSQWSMGYAFSTDEELLATFTTLSTPDLLQNMPKLVADIDMEP
jgi:hypothetical protein